MSQPILIALVALAGLVALAVLAVVALALTNPEAARRRVLSLFRRPPRAARTPGQDHYYKPYWS
jgi:hypothetical protein